LKIQQYRLFKQLAHGYAFKLIGMWISEQVETIEGGELGKLNNIEKLKEVAITSAALKSLCTQVAYNGIEDLRKCCGGNGYLLNSGIAALRNEYLVQVTAEGDMAVMAILSGKFLAQTIDSVKRGNATTGLMDYFNVFSNNNLNIKSLLPQKAKSSTEFFNIDYLLRLFSYKSLFKCFTLYTEFVKLISEGVELQKAFETLAIEASQATYSHCYYIILLTFVNKIKQIKNTKISNVLTKLCSLFACTVIKDDNWGDILASDQFRLINTAITSLLSDIRPDCVPLCDSFDYSDYSLKSTIGRYDGNVYEALFDAAQHSTLNRQEVFEGYEEVLRPHLNLSLLRYGNKHIDLITKF